MQYIPIKQENKNGEKVFVINAIPLKNKNKSVIQKIPHPTGTDFLSYSTLEDAKDAIIRAGFTPILPDGKKDFTATNRNTKKDIYDEKNYETIVLQTIKEKINSSNSNVVQAAISALAEFPSEETFEVFFEKIGEENDLIRKNAISGICRYGNILTDRIIAALDDKNWVARNSAITCIKTLVQNHSDIEKFIQPLVNTCQDINPIVQANALTTLAIVYQQYKKNN